MSDSDTAETYWYEALGDKHYFIQAESMDDGLYFREVTPLVHRGSQGYYRVHPWKRVKDGLTQAFHDDHTERERPSNWNGARLEEA